MQERIIPVAENDNDTPHRILDTATRFFAIKGYHAVTMRDIARSVGIKMSSIYYYYESKEALLEDIIVQFKNDYENYFAWLSKANKEAETLEEVLDNFFNKEFLEVKNPLTCLSMSIIVKEQHNNPLAKEILFELIYKTGIQVLQADLGALIAKGVIPSSDTKTLATIFMFCVLAGNDLSVYKVIGEEIPIDHIKVYVRLKNIFSSLLSQGGY